MVTRALLQSGRELGRWDELRATDVPRRGGRASLPVPRGYACGQSKLRARAKVAGERVVVERRLCGVEITETFLPASADDLVVIVKVDNDVLSPSLTFRRVYRPVATE